MPRRDREIDDPTIPPMGRSSRTAPEPKRRSASSRIAAALLVATLIAGAGVGYVALSPPVGLIRDQLIAQVKAKTGRDLTIAGPVSFTVFPRLGLSLRDVTLSAPPSMGGAPLAIVPELQARVRLLPLLMRQISVDSLVVRQPIFTLRADAKGKRSWDFAELAPAPLVQYAQAAAPKSDALPDVLKDFANGASDPDNPSPQTKARLARLEELTLGDVRVEGGTVLYRDERTGAATDITAIDAAVGLKTLASPLDASGTLTYGGQPVTFEVKLASPKAIIEDRAAKLTLAVAGAPLDLKYDGTVTVRSALDLDGEVNAKTASLRALVAWLGAQLPPADGFGAASLAGTVKVSGQTATLTLKPAMLDATSATGTIGVDTSAGKPRITANLRLSELDLNRYTLAAGKALPAAPAQPVPAAAPGSISPAAQPAPQSIDDLLRGTVGGPKVKGYTKRAGWSTDPIVLDALGSADVDARVATGKLLYKELKAGAATMTVALKGKVLRANFDDVQLYDGRGRGFLSIDANPQPPVIGGNLSLEGVSAQPLLRDAADIESFLGTAKVSLAVGAQGNTEAELISTANGKADLIITNGAVAGYDLGGTLKGLTQGKLTGLDRSPNLKTEFTELSANFAIANGVATNHDMKLEGPVLRATGAGSIQLPAQSIDYTVRPKLSVPGQSQVSEVLAGVEVPVRVQGPWAGPKVFADAGAVTADQKTVETVKEIGRKLKDNEKVKEIGGAIKDMFKGGNGANDSATKSKAKSLFDKLFKNSN